MLEQYDYVPGELVLAWFWVLSFLNPRRLPPVACRQLVRHAGTFRILESLIDDIDYPELTMDTFEIEHELIVYVTRALLLDLMVTPAEDFMHDSVTRVLRACMLYYQRRYTPANAYTFVQPIVGVYRTICEFDGRV